MTRTNRIKVKLLFDYHILSRMIYFEKKFYDPCFDLSYEKADLHTCIGIFISDFFRAEVVSNATICNNDKLFVA